MRGRSAKVIRRFAEWAGQPKGRVRNAWLALPHRERGRKRVQMLRAMAADSRPLSAFPMPRMAYGRHVEPGPRL